MQIRFLIGPAGSGKTHRCLAEIREALIAAPAGPPLILLSPKQATFQLERQLLGWGEDTSGPDARQIDGYTRLRILSFERLARFVFEELRLPTPKILNEEGRLMVLRAIIARRRGELKLFRASARLAGFAQQLSLVLHEFQRNKLSPDNLLRCAEQAHSSPGLSLKLRDLATLLRDYLEWLDEHDLQDADCLLASATKALAEAETGPNFKIDSVWLDGFSEFSPHELDLLTAHVSRCGHATLAFCLDREPDGNTSWLSNWSLVRRAFEDCRNRLKEIPGAQIIVEELPRDPVRNRFATNPVLAHFEKHWAEPERIAFRESSTPTGSSLVPTHLRLVTCADPEAEATLAAREILRFVRAGGRFREASVIVRTLDGYHEVLQRVFARYEIPFFLDRRESVAHHPLAELTRSAMRLCAFNWAREDFFAALKTGLVPVKEDRLDELENEALARGWEGAAWLKPIHVADDAGLSSTLEKLRQKIVPPFQELAAQLVKTRNRPNGGQLAQALRAFWNALEIEQQLDEWSASFNGSEAGIPASVHATVWEQMNSWLDNLARAFPAEALPLREWLPILEAGLANLAVGVIPPALDQVLIGAIDRSRNPDIKLALALGWNEGIFPAPPMPAPLLTENDRDELEKRGAAIGTGARQQIARERYFAYIACTRARQRLVITCSALDSRDKPLNSSPFFARIRELFPQLEIETPARSHDWRRSEHPREFIAPLLRARHATAKIDHWNRIADQPALASALGHLRHLQVAASDQNISPALAEKLYGAILCTSVSRLEQFAACPFKFFIHSGLRAEERKLFELDVREQGSFQHDVLSEFHEQLCREGKKWRDITPREARERVGAIANALAENFRDGLLQSSEQARFTARVLAGSLQDFVEALVGWMAGQYLFDPVKVELPFGEAGGHPAWELDLGDGHRLALRGRIDRVDVCAQTRDEALCVVVDYKSSEKKLDPLLIQHGLQLQLLAYLNVLQHWLQPEKLFGRKLTPAGVFYVNLRGKYTRQASRTAALDGADEARKLAYRHSGKFDAAALEKLDSRNGAMCGDQFNYRRNKDGAVSKTSREALNPDEFAALLRCVEGNLKRMGAAIFSGETSVSPFRKGATTACQQCDYQPICRIDPWTHTFRALRAEENPK